MNPEAYQAYTAQLQRNLQSDARVVGLVMVGSSAAQSHMPDQFSDHDFFVVVESGHQPAFRHNLDWLPDASQIVFSYQETAHGLKVIYENGHLVEFAIFDGEELFLAKVNDYRVLIDRAGIAQSVEKIRLHSTEDHGEDDVRVHVGNFIGQIMIGMARYHRGELLSAHVFIKQYALDNLLWLLAKYETAADRSRLDNLDAHRRFEGVFPALGAAINAMLLRPIPVCADEMIDIFEARLENQLADYPRAALQTLRYHVFNED